MFTVDCGSDVSFKGQENIGVFASSDWAERGFCKKCGSHLFYRLKQANQYIMPAGIFDNSEKLVFDHQTFEVDVEFLEGEAEWSPYLSAGDAYKLDDVRDALRRGDIAVAVKLARVFALQPAAVSQ